MQAVPEMFDLIKLEGDPKPGTHIAVQRPFKDLHPSLKVLYPFVSDANYYYHHGVLLKNSQVIHFTGETIEDAKPRRTGISEFRQGALDEKLYRARYNYPTSVVAVEETFRNAEEVLKDPSKFPKYNILNNNCESLATWLKTGEARTAQGTDAKKRVVAIGAALGAAAGSSIGGNLDAALTGAAVGSVASSALLSTTSSTLLSSGIGDKSGSSKKSGSSDS